jgi:hypothetical protein
MTPAGPPPAIRRTCRERTAIRSPAFGYRGGTWPQACLLRVGLDKPIVRKISGSGIIATMRQSWLGRLELRYLRKWARRVMILNHGMAEEAASAGFEPLHLLWMANGLDTGEFASCDSDCTAHPIRCPPFSLT